MEPSNIWDQLLAERAKVQSEFASAIDSVQRRRLHEWLGLEMNLEDKYNAIQAEAERLIRQRQPGSPERGDGQSRRLTDQSADWSLLQLADRQRARIARHSYLRREQDRGNFIEQLSGDTLYRRKSDGSILGITFSIPKNKDKAWFLGLPKGGPFHEAVLLCQYGPRTVKVVHLSKQICEKYRSQLSSNRRQFLFNIKRNGARWSMQLPSQLHDLDITECVEEGELDCSRDYDEFV